MNGLDPAIASLLAAQADILMDAMRPAGGTSTSQAGTSQFFVDTEPGTAPASPLGANLPAGPSTQTQLSSVALTLDAISRFGGTATPPVMSSTPLWPGAALVVAASALGSMGGGRFVVGAPAVVSPPVPPLPAAELAATLAKVVDQSGLFYEAHLAQWVSGQRAEASLADEPQAGVDAFTPAPSFEAPAPPAPPAPPAGAWNEETLASQPFIDDPLNPVRTVPTPQTPQQASALAASVRGAPAAVFTSGAALTQQSVLANASSNAAHAQDTAVQASIAAGIHPATIPLVRQQLDLLATDQFRWSGEAWPGASFQWEIAPREHDAQTPDAAAPERSWRTRVTLSLPQLGPVDADLVLTGKLLAVRVQTSGIGGVRLFSDGEHFRQQLDAAGIQLAGFTVRSLDEPADAEPFDGGGA
jgi:Flagellar hook-length control protein FliK